MYAKYKTGAKGVEETVVVDTTSEKKMRVLIVEDDNDINTLLKKILARAGFEVAQAYSGTEARLRLENEHFDMILLDLMLPGITGEELLSHIRGDKKLSIPVIVISAKAAITDKVQVLQSGADDYLTKPFAAEEVIARIEVVLRRSKKESRAQEIYEHRNLQLNSETRRVRFKERDIHLTAHEFSLLEILIRKPDTVFPRERLYQMIWGGEHYGDDNTINVHISNIRKKLGEVSDEAYIQTVWGIGFKLV